eukprot:Platyproteum_vivax@DN12118_c0_g1_i1.p1
MGRERSKTLIYDDTTDDFDLLFNKNICQMAWNDYEYISKGVKGSKTALTQQLQAAEIYLLDMRRKKADKVVDDEETRLLGERSFEQYKMIADDLKRQDKFDEAEYMYKRCIDVATEVGDSLMSAEAELGFCENMSAHPNKNLVFHWQDTLNHLAQAQQHLSLSPDCPTKARLLASSLALGTHTFLSLGTYYLSLQNWEAAEFEFKKCSDYAQNMGAKGVSIEKTIVVNMGKVSAAKGQHNDAIEKFKKGMQESNTTERNLAALELAKVHLKRGEGTTALSLLNNTLNNLTNVKPNEKAMDPADEKLIRSEIMLHLALIHYEQGGKKAALEWLEKHCFECTNIQERDSGRVLVGLLKGETNWHPKPPTEA